MRILKELIVFHYDDKFYDPKSLIGKFISEIELTLQKEDLFIEKISSIKFWDLPKLSLWSFYDILNYIDDLLIKYKNEINEIKIEEKILKILTFLKLILNNCLNKDIFSSFDNLQEIFFKTFNIHIKNEILDIYSCFADIKKSMNASFMEFEDFGNVLVPFRQILIDILLNNNFNISEKNFLDMEYLLKTIQKDWKKVLIEKNQRIDNKERFIKEIEPYNLFKTIIEEKKSYNSILNFPNNQFEYEYYTKYYEKSLDFDYSKYNNSVNKYLLKEEKYYTMMINSYLTLISELITSKENSEIKMREISKFVLTMINFYITFTQKRKKQTIIITEYYIEKYLKDVLSIITSKNSLDMKIIFLNSCISFMNNLDGYESILFQNGLFHSILSDLTHQNENNFEVLNYEESINQNFFNSVVVFLYKTSSFKEIPVYFLNKVLEVPKNNIYPYRIDNVIYSLKKKRIIDEPTLNGLILPRLKYELNNIFISEKDLSYLDKNINFHPPSILERTTLISKLFKILYKIFEQNTTLNQLRNLEEPLMDIVSNVLKNDNMINNEHYNLLLFCCVEFDIKVFNFYPSKIPQYINKGYMNTLFNLFQKGIPKMNGCLNLIFQMLYTISLHQEGKKYLIEDDKTKK